MKEYPKIQTIFKRDMEKGPSKNKIIVGDWTMPEFEFLKDIKWEATEKIDGTNVRVQWDEQEGKVWFGGRTKDAQMHVSLVNYLVERFPASVFSGLPSMIIFGEGFGNKIQKVGSKYISDGVSFNGFDIFCGNLWLGRNNVINILHKIGVDYVPNAGMMTLNEACDLVSNGLKSAINVCAPAEGFVLRAPCGLLTRTGNRLITKIKVKDFLK